jgi:rRNA maturation protein Rpf1
MNPIMKIPLVFCHITKYNDDTDVIKLCRINKFSYESLAKYVNLTEYFTMEQLKQHKKFQIRALFIRSSDELKELLIHPLCTKIHELKFNNSMNDVIEQYPQNIKKLLLVLITTSQRIIYQNQSFMSHLVNITTN